MERLTSRLDMALQGKTDINITTRALSKDFTMEITTSKMNGKALFGGMLHVLLIKHGYHSYNPNCRTRHTDEKSCWRLQTS